jgi:hypothetical protein
VEGLDNNGRRREHQIPMPFKPNNDSTKLLKEVVDFGLKMMQGR